MADTQTIQLLEDDWTAMPDVAEFMVQNLSQNRFMRFAFAASKPADDFKGHILGPGSMANRFSTGVPWVYTTSKDSCVAFTEVDL